MAQQQAKSDPVLDAFDRLRLREVRAAKEDTTASFLARFQSTAASLGSDERIELEICQQRESSMKLLKVVLADPHASKICSLRWKYDGEEDVKFGIPLLLSKCPNLALLEVDFQHHSSFDVVSSVLEHPSNRITVLEMPRYTKGNIPRFVAALGQSRVTALTICGDVFPKFAQGLCQYLAKDLLVRLKLKNHKQVPFEMMMSLANCTRLAKLEMVRCEFFQLGAFTHLPKSITKLVLYECRFTGSFDWSFLAGSNVQELAFYSVTGVDGSQLGGALAVHLRTKGLDTLCIDGWRFAMETLAAIGAELGRIQRLDIGNVNSPSVELIALALQSPNSEMKELKLWYNEDTMSGIENCLVPALRHPNCNLVKLSFHAFQEEHKAAARRVEHRFRNRRALFLLLQGRQGRRKSPLKRLPVEMFRLVGRC